MDNRNNPSTSRQEEGAAFIDHEPIASSAVIAIRKILQEKFLDRLKNSRCQCYNTIKNILEKAGHHVTLKTINELKNTLVDADETYLLDFDEVNDFFDNIKYEHMEMETDMQNEESDDDEEFEEFPNFNLDEIINRHFTANCSSCGTPLIGETGDDPLCALCQLVTPSNNKKPK